MADSVIVSTADLNACKASRAWSDRLARNYGPGVAVCFALGHDRLAELIDSAMEALARMPRGTHIGQLEICPLRGLLPPQFLTRYDYEFIYCLHVNLETLRIVARQKEDFTVGSVVLRLLLNVIYALTQQLAHRLGDVLGEADMNGLSDWDPITFGLMGDPDVIAFLYSDEYVAEDHPLHFDRWLENPDQ